MTEEEKDRWQVIAVTFAWCPPVALITHLVTQTLR